MVKINGRFQWVMMALPVMMLGACQEPDVAGLMVQSAWVRAMPPGSKMTAAYFDLKNNSSEPVRIIAVSSSEFSSVSMHESIVVDGVARMEAISVLELDPGETVKLEPGGKHLMLMGSQFAELPVDCCTLRLEVEGKGPFIFHARIRSRPE